MKTKKNAIFILKLSQVFKQKYFLLIDNGVKRYRFIIKQRQNQNDFAGYIYLFKYC